MLNRRRLMAMVSAAALAAGVAAATPAHVFAGNGPSLACSDGLGGDDLPVTVTNPITLGLELGGTPTHVSVCYSTTPTGDTEPEITGGYIVADTSLNCFPDSNPQAIAVACSVNASPPSLSFNIPFTLCATQCIATGDITATVSPAGTAAFTINTCVTIDGVTLACPTTTVGVNLSGLPSDSVQGVGPCFLNGVLCLPNSASITTPSGAIFLPLLAPITVPGLHVCIVDINPNSSNPPC